MGMTAVTVLVVEKAAAVGKEFAGRDGAAKSATSDRVGVVGTLGAESRDERSAVEALGAVVGGAAAPSPLVGVREVVVGARVVIVGVIAEVGVTAAGAIAGVIARVIVARIGGVGVMVGVTTGV